MKLASYQTSAGRRSTLAAEQLETPKVLCGSLHDRLIAPPAQPELARILSWRALGRFARLALVLAMFVVMLNGTSWFQRAGGRPCGAELLFAGIQGKCPEWVDEALAAGVSVNALSKDGTTPLYWAAEIGNEALVGRLISANADVSAECPLGVTPLMVASARGNVDAMRVLIDAGADVNHVSPVGSALHWAAVGAQLGALDVLLEQGADINAQNRDGQTPLMSAVFSQEIPTVRRLVAAGADVNAVDHDGQTARMYAAAERQWELVEILDGL